MAAAQEVNATAAEICGNGDSEKKGGANENRESLKVYKNSSEATAAGGGGKAVKTVGNATVAIDVPSDSLTVTETTTKGGRIRVVQR